MKKKLLILAVAGLALASCSNDETVAVNQNDSNAISFRPLMTGVTRAATDITASNLASFNVTAFTTGTNTSAYINDVTFTKQLNGTYTSANKYYWPDGNLDFYAYYWDNSLSGISKTDYRTFTVTPAVTTETAGNQVDLVYAALKNKGKSDGAAGLPMNFSHIGSKIALKVTHSGASNPNAYFEVKAWGVGYLDAEGTFTFPTCAENSTANTTTGTLPVGYWSNNAAWATDKQIYRSTDLDPVAIIGPVDNTPSGAVTTYTFDEQMILVPQGTIPAATKYQATTSAAKPEGSYVAVKMAVKNVTNGSVIQDETWAMWPVSVNWEPGKKYTYNVIIDNGGYFEGNTNDGDDDLDPVLEGSEIYFAGVTVSDWNTTPGETDVTIPTSNLRYGTNYTFNNANLADGTETMTFNIGGLAGNKYIKVTKGGTDGAAQVASSTPALDAVTLETGTDQVVTVTLNANAGSAKTMTITIQEYDDSAGNTASGTPTVITINQAAS